MLNGEIKTFLTQVLAGTIYAVSAFFVFVKILCARGYRCSGSPAGLAASLPGRYFFEEAI